MNSLTLKDSIFEASGQLVFDTRCVQNVLSWNFCTQLYRKGLWTDLPFLVQVLFQQWRLPTWCWCQSKCCDLHLDIPFQCLCLTMFRNISHFERALFCPKHTHLPHKYPTVIFLRGINCDVFFILWDIAWKRNIARSSAERLPICSARYAIRNCESDRTLPLNVFRKSLAMHLAAPKTAAYVEVGGLPHYSVRMNSFDRDF